MHFVIRQNIEKDKSGAFLPSLTVKKVRPQGNVIVSTYRLTSRKAIDVAMADLWRLAKELKAIIHASGKSNTVEVYDVSYDA